MVTIPASIITHEALETIGQAMADATGARLRKRWQAFTGNEAVICDLLLEATDGVIPLLPHHEHYHLELGVWQTWAGYPCPMTHAVHRYGEVFGEQPVSLDDYWAVQHRCRVLALLFEWHLLPDKPACP